MLSRLSLVAKAKFWTSESFTLPRQYSSVSQLEIELGKQGGGKGNVLHHSMHFFHLPGLLGEMTPVNKNWNSLVPQLTSVLKAVRLPFGS